MLKISARKGIQSISTTPNNGLKVEVTQGTYCFTLPPHILLRMRQLTHQTLQCYSVTVLKQAMQS